LKGIGNHDNGNQRQQFKLLNRKTTEKILATTRRNNSTGDKLMSIDRYSLLQQGIYVNAISHTEKLQALAISLRAQRTRHELVRLGAPYDGGYLVPDDFENLQACFSPGVADCATFEESLLTKYGIQSHLADYSVDGPPAGFIPKSFQKKYLGPLNDEQHTTLQDWIHSTEEHTGDLILQMDIEGGEYLSIIACPEAVLRRFRIIVIEIHDIESWSEPNFFKVVDAFFQKLLKHFIVIHNHPNNCCGIVNLGGFLSPRVFELTLLRRDRAHSLGNCETFPHPLDRPNLMDRPDLLLPNNWTGIA